MGERRHIGRTAQGLRSEPVAAPRRESGSAAAGPSSTFAALLAALGLVAAASAAFARMEPYLSSYVIAARVQGGLTMTCVAAGAILSQPAWAMLGQRRGLPAVLAGAGATWSLGAAALLAQLAARPAPPSALDLALCGLAYGCGSGGTMMSLWGVVAETARSLPQATPRAFAAVGAVSKIGGAISAFLTAALLSSVSYRVRGHAGLLTLACAAPVLAGLFCLVLGAALTRLRQDPAIRKADLSTARSPRP